MENIFQTLKEIITAVSIYELLLIYVARVVEVSIGTFRYILMSKGNRLISSILAFIEVLIWVIVASNVLTNIIETPIKVVVYSFGYASGVYFGSIIESKVALGNVLIQAIVPLSKGQEIVTTLRSEGLGVTTVNAEGKDSEKIMIMIYARRRKKDKIISKIHSLESSALIVSNEVSTMQGGYLGPKRQFIK